MATKKDDDLGFVADDDLGFVAEDQGMEIGNPLGFEPQTEMTEQPTAPSRMGELRKRDEAAINVYGLDQPEQASEQLLQQQRIKAFADPFLNIAAPVGQPSREMEISRIKKEAEIEGREITSEEAVQQADYERKLRSEAFPTESMAGAGAGFITAGALGPAAEAAAATRITKNIASPGLKGLSKELTELGLMSVEGGLTNMAANRPKDIEEAFKQFSLGTVLSAAPIAVLKTPGLTRESWQVAKEWNQAIVKKANENIVNTDVLLKQQLKDIESGITLSEKQVNRAETVLNNAKTELDMIERVKRPALDVLAEQPQITARVAELPDKIYNQTLGSRLQMLGEAKGQMLDQVGSKLVKTDKEYERAATKLMKLKGATPEAQTAIDSARNVLDQFQGSLKQGKIGTPADPMTGYKGSERTITYSSVKDLDAAKQQIQDLLYDKQWRKSAPVPVRSVLQEFEVAIRNKIASADPTGQLRNVNSAYSGIKNLQADFEELADQTYFLQLAKDKLDNPKVRDTYDKLLNGFNPKSKGGYFADELFKDPLFKKEIAGVKKEINEMVESSTNDYGRYLEAKKLVDTLDIYEARLSDKIENFRNRLETRQQSAATKKTQKAGQEARIEENLSKKVRGLQDIVLPERFRAAVVNPFMETIDKGLLGPLGRAYEKGSSLAKTIPGRISVSGLKGAAIEAPAQASLEKQEEKASKKKKKSLEGK